jgi:hypothetical protein
VTIYFSFQVSGNTKVWMSRNLQENPLTGSYFFEPSVFINMQLFCDGIMEYCDDYRWVVSDEKDLFTDRTLYYQKLDYSCRISSASAGGFSAGAV